MEKILISFDKNLLIRIEEELKRTGHGATRSGFVREACEKYLDIRRGIANRIRRKQLASEV